MTFGEIEDRMTDTTLPPGRELNSRVAEILGEPKPTRSPCDLRHQQKYPQRWVDRANTKVGYWYWEARPFSTSIIDTWLVLEKIRTDDRVGEVSVWWNDEFGWCCDVHPTEEGHVRGLSSIEIQHCATAPHAICLAALAALQAQESDHETQ